MDERLSERLGVARVRVLAMATVPVPAEGATAVSANDVPPEKATPPALNGDAARPKRRRRLGSCLPSAGRNGRDSL